MFRFILIVLTILFFGIPFLYEQAFATETKVIEMNGKQWLVTIEPGEDPIFKSLEPKPAKVTKLPFVIHGSPEEKSIIPVVDVKKEPEWQKKTVKESKLVQVCNDPMGCEMTVEGDCPDCKTELVTAGILILKLPASQLLHLISPIGNLLLIAFLFVEVFYL